MGMITATANDIRATLKTRLNTQAHLLSDSQLDTLTIDVMNTINTDAANATAHAATEIASNKVRPFQRHV